MLTVTPAALTITANNRTKSFGQTVTFAGTEFTTSALLNNDTVTSVTLTSAGATAAATVATYSIVPSAAVGTGLGNYTLTYVDGLLTVTASLPPLNIETGFSPQSILLSWTTNVVGFSLQMTTNLSSATDWIPISGSKVVGDQNEFSTNTSGASTFFRLKQ
jgi:hypothetical protein